MRAVLQRVSSAAVAVDGQTISQISRGVMVLIGIGTSDTLKDADVIVKKILSMRVFDDGDGNMWKQSVKDIEGEILCVSQFTLMANTTKGNKPDFHGAMSSESSKTLYIEVLNKIRDAYHPDKVKDGQFGAMMSVSLVNEGPVTLQLDSRKYVENTPAEPSRGSKKSPAIIPTPEPQAED